MRLIDADAAVKRIEELSDKTRQLENNFSASWIVGFLEARPTVEAKPITRCKDCLGFIPSICYCNYFDASRSGDDFCSSAMNKYGKENEK